MTIGLNQADIGRVDLFENCGNHKQKIYIRFTKTKKNRMLTQNKIIKPQKEKETRNRINWKTKLKWQ